MNKKIIIIFAIVFVFVIAVVMLKFAPPKTTEDIALQNEQEDAEEKPLAEEFPSEEWKKEAAELTFPDNTLDVSDWQTYRNEEFGFEVKYPRDWEVKDFSKFNFNDKRIVFHYPWTGDGDDGGVYLYYEESLRDISEKIISRAPNISYTKKTVYVNNAVVTQFFGTSFFDDELLNFKTYVISNGHNTFEFNDLPSGYFSQELEQILLSFRFIE